MSKTTFKPMAISTLNAQIQGFTGRTVRAGKVGKIKRDLQATVLFIQSLYQIAGQSKADASKANGNINPMLALLDKLKATSVHGLVFRAWLDDNAEFVNYVDGVALDQGWVKKALAIDFDAIDMQNIVDEIEAEKKHRKELKAAEPVDTTETIQEFLDKEIGRLANHSNAELIELIKATVEDYYAERDQDDEEPELEEALAA